MGKYEGRKKTASLKNAKKNPRRAKKIIPDPSVDLLKFNDACGLALDFKSFIMELSLIARIIEAFREKDT